MNECSVYTNHSLETDTHISLTQHLTTDNLIISTSIKYYLDYMKVESVKLYNFTVKMLLTSAKDIKIKIFSYWVFL